MTEVVGVPAQPAAKKAASGVLENGLALLSRLPTGSR
jgi:hypothetical protein